MKSNSNQQPPRIQDLGNGNSHFNFNIQPTEATEHQGAGFNYDTVIVPNPVTYGKTIAALVREKYSQDDEIAIIRQKETKPEQYEEYFNYVENCKIIARDE